MKSLDFIIDHVTTIIHINVVIIYIHDVNNNRLWCKSNLGSGLVLSLDQTSIAKTVLESCEPYIMPEAANDPLFNSAFDKAYDITTRNILCLPIINDKDEAIGVIQVVNKVDGKDFTLHDKYMAATGTFMRVVL
jgi:hypothetical protein